MHYEPSRHLAKGPPVGIGYPSLVPAPSAGAGHRPASPQRLKQLDREWDIERAIEANASSLMLVGLGLGLGVDRKFLALPLVVSAFLLQHALQGWCPPVTVFRRLGIRTQGEIEEERRRLLAIQRYTAH
jgi:hypothetical protein